jgi:hypothetical protein
MPHMDAAATTVNLIFTGVIAFATICYTIAAICYTIYAAKQWKTLKRQADDAQAVQAARLTFEGFQANIIPEPIFVADVTVTVRNNGSTVADDIHFGVESRTYNLRYNPNPETSKGQRQPTPDPAGPSLGPGQTHKFFQPQVGKSPIPPIEADVPGIGKIRTPHESKTEDVQHGNERFSITLTLSYTDIFGKGHVTTDCMTYDARQNPGFPLLTCANTISPLAINLLPICAAPRSRARGSLAAKLASVSKTALTFRQLLMLISGRLAVQVNRSISSISCVSSEYCDRRSNSK